MDKYKNNSDLFYKDAFERNIGILTEVEQGMLNNSTVAVIGCGGVGGMHIMNLVRTGIGALHIADMDNFEVANFQRQSGASMDTVGLNKAAIMKDMALAVNPHLKIKVFEDGVTDDNIDEFLSGADVLVDGIDFFAFYMRRKVFNKAREKGMYTVTAGPLGFGSALLVFSPDGMVFDEYFDIKDEMSYEDKLIAFAVGLAPASIHMGYLDLNKVDLSSGKGPALVSACNICSGLAVTEVIKILLGKQNIKCVRNYFQFDPFLQKYKKGYLIGANRNPIQLIKRWYLSKKFKKSGASK
ncbi:MAG: ThiF family adenylyltransferase [Candidatus Omnitrophica bacterium]|nr:ThiF family adenylyltransferase [Candidatus Omnitrophota bacterium]